MNLKRAFSVAALAASVACFAIPAQAGAQLTAQQRTQGWGVMVKAAAARSARQNNGKPIFNRVCNPAVSLCASTIFFMGENGKLSFMREVFDVSGRLVARDICELNSYGDVRSCVNWDSGKTTTEMKDAHGDWIAVGR